MTLDYIPALRNIAFIERNVMLAFEKLKDAPEEEETTNRYRRRTRRRGPLVRDHYFKDLIYTNCDADANDLGTFFADKKLKRTMNCY